MKRTRYETEDATVEQKRPSYNGRDNIGSVTVKDLVCQLPPTCSPTAPSRFSSIADFEQHYNQFHSFRCIECQRSFPSDRFLDLHIAENHDPFFKLRLERGEKVYMCFVEDCDKLCADPAKRRLHVIDKHNYPKDFLFSIINTGVHRNQTSLLKQRQTPYQGQP
ncbi:conserved hypothetical protein [Geotrichum candidum]|uniref:C2H2-type domain-containing protein n=1 Tax=Geotrichum candidum TaxID=1173061 RepID=A0A0J9X8F6_GEOCN|nr:conserved hypothetical protein [Geotrichum candidum]